MNMPKKQTKKRASNNRGSSQKNLSDLAATLDATIGNNGESEHSEPGENEVCYVVIRRGARVGPDTYPTPDDTEAIKERDFWQRAENFRNPHPTKVEIVKYDKKKHRIW